MRRLSWSISLGISSQFTLEMCAAAKNEEKFTKPHFKVQGRSRSSMVINLKKPITIACYDKQHVCAYLQPFSRYTSH